MGNRKSTDIPNSGDAIVDGYHNDEVLGGNGARESLDWTNAVWPNVLEIAISQNNSPLSAGVHGIETGDILDIDFIYRSYANESAITVYADLDRNPYNDNNIVIDNQNTSETGSTITESSINWTVQDLIVGNTYYIYAVIDDGTHKRYVYSNHELEVVPTQEAPTAGNGSESNPYQIANLENLYWLSQNAAFWDAHYIQTADIDAAETETWFSGEGFPPIGTEAEPFTGVYDGDNYTVSNLYINSPLDYVGLFGHIWDGGSLKNIILENASIIATSNSGWFYAGALAGYNFRGEVYNCHSSGTVLGDNDGATGGLIGSIEQDANVSNSSSSCSVSGVMDVGGFAGDISYSDVTNCKATGEVTGSSYVGGFTGYILGARINNCFAKGNVSGSEYIGGFVSEIRYSSDPTNITNSYSWGNVTRLTGATDEHIASFIGNCSDNGSTAVEISYSYAIGAVIYEDAANPTDKGFIGGEIGTNTYTANFFDGSASEQTSGIGASIQTTSGMQTMSTFTDAGWDFMGETTNGENDYWGINQNENNGYPFLKWQGYKLYTEVTENPTAESLQCPTALENVTLTGGAANTEGSFAFANPTDIPPAGTSQHEVIFTPNDVENYSTISLTIDVTVEDDIHPEITSTHDAQTIDANDNCEASLPDYTGDLTATDNCSDFADITVTQTPEAGTVISGAENAVTLTATDEAGNFAEVSFNAEVVDNTNPVITCIENQSIDLNEGESFYTVQGTEFDPTDTDDNCGISSVENDYNNTETLAGEEFTAGTHTITWTVTDNSGNTADCNFDVTINVAVGISDFQNLKTSIYPNPFSNELVIETEGNTEELTFEIINAMGQVVLKGNLFEKTTVQTNNFAPGVYLIKLGDENIFEFKKVIKE
ncbi:MAG: GLUG motif-containing protein, partial [Bacteroidales bacterium]